MPGADFLAFVQASRIVADGNFVDAMAQPNRFGGDFRAEIKPAALQIHLAKQSRWKKLVARGFIGQVCAE